MILEAVVDCGESKAIGGQGLIRPGTPVTIEQSERVEAVG